MMHYIQTIFAILISLFLTACGGGGGTSVEQEPLKSLTFIDSPVNGIAYSCGGREGKTQSSTIDGVQKHGVAECRKGSVTFSIGKLVIGVLDTYQEGQEIFLQDLVGISRDQINDDVLKLGMLIQSLDDDGDIETKIDISDAMSAKVTIESIDGYDISTFQAYVASITGITPDMDAVKNHILLNTGIPLIEEKNITLTLQDDTSVGTIIKNLSIKNATEDMEIILIDGGEQNEFSFLSDGSIMLNKALDFRKQNLYHYTIKAKNSKGYSKETTLTIKVQSANETYNQPLKKPTPLVNKIYTNKDEYTLSLTAQKGVNLYVDSQKIATLSHENIALTQKIVHTNASQKLSLTIGYDNGMRSEPVEVEVIHDTIEPIIETNATLFVKENTKLVGNLKATDSNPILFSLSDTTSHPDNGYFILTSQGELNFRFKFDYESPYDGGRDNGYSLGYWVSDLAGNKKFQNLEIGVTDEKDSKPTIESTHIGVSIDEAVGNSIGRILIDKGDGDFIGISLSGDGSEHFEITPDGELRLIQKFTQATRYELTLTATNSFGSTHELIYIDVLNIGKVAKIEVGQLSNATIKLYKLRLDNTKELIESMQSNELGDFDMMPHLLEEGYYYIYEVTRGHTTHSDVDHDGIIDDYATDNQGVIRLIMTKGWLTGSSHPIRITALGEMYYLYDIDGLASDYAQIGNRLDSIAKTLLDDDLNGDGKINAEDIIIFNPTFHRLSLKIPIQKRYETIITKILDNDIGRYKYIFDTKVIKEFDENATGCSPTTLCAFELQPTKIKYRNNIAYVLKENRLFLYDTTQEKTISHIDFADGDYGLYLDLTNSRIYLSSPTQDREIITIDISNLETPKVVDSQLHGIHGYIIGRVNDALLIYQDSELLVVDIGSPESAQEITHYSLPIFDQVIYTNGYSFTVADNQLLIKQYNLQNLQNISQSATYQINNVADNTKAFMNEKQNIYLLTPNLSIDFYQIITGVATFKSTLDINATDIINTTDNQLYLYGNHTIYQIDISDITHPRIEKSFNFEQTTTNLYFDEGLLYTPRYIIDTNAMMLSSPYLEIDTTQSNTQYDIKREKIKDYLIFAPF